MIPDDGEADFYFDGDLDECDANSDTVPSNNGEKPTCTARMLPPIESCSAAIESSEPGNQSLSMEYLGKLEETPWKCNSPFFDIPVMGVIPNFSVTISPPQTSCILPVISSWINTFKSELENPPDNSSDNLSSEPFAGISYHWFSDEPEASIQKLQVLG